MIDGTLFYALKTATKEKPVQKHEYSLTHNLDERSFRDMVSEMRENGIRVVSSSNQRGYWIAKSEAEYRAFRKQHLSRAKTIEAQVYAMDINGPDRIDGQLEMEV